MNLLTACLSKYRNKIAYYFKTILYTVLMKSLKLLIEPFQREKGYTRHLRKTEVEIAKS